MNFKTNINRLAIVAIALLAGLPAFGLVSKEAKINNRYGCFITPEERL